MTKSEITTSRRNCFFDMIKMICVIMVIITHISWSSDERNFLIFPYLIDMAVPVFMIISATLRAGKMEKIGFKKFISPRNTLKSLESIMIAYVIVAVIEIFAAIFISALNPAANYSYLQSPSEFFIWFFTGLTGPGSYYIPIMVQLIIYFPLLWLLVRKFKSVGLFVCFAINSVYEIIVYQVNMNTSLYRLLIFGYTFLIALGIYFYMAQNRKRDDITAFLFLLVGLSFITVNAYIRPFALFQEWKRTSMLCVPFAYGALYLLKKYFGEIPYNKVSIVGRASLHIYLTQMVFFGFGAGGMLRKVFQFMPNILNRLCSSVVAISICVPVGMAFFFVESKIKSRLFSRQRKI